MRSYIDNTNTSLYLFEVNKTAFYIIVSKKHCLPAHTPGMRWFHILQVM